MFNFNLLNIALLINTDLKGPYFYDFSFSEYFSCSGNPENNTWWLVNMFRVTGFWVIGFEHGLI